MRAIGGQTKREAKRALGKRREKSLEAKVSEGLQAQHQELQALHEISQTILSSPDLKTILEEVLNRALEIGPFDIGIIRLLEPTGTVLKAVVSRGYQDPRNVTETSTDPRDPTAGLILVRVMAEKEARVVENVSECDGLRSFKREGVQSAVVVSVRAQEQVLGTIELGSRTSRKFKPNEVYLLEAIGNQMGVAVQKARLYEQADRRRKHAEALREIGLSLTAAHDPQQVLERIAEEARQLTSALFTFVVTPNKPFYQVAAVAGDDHGYRDNLKLSDDPVSPYGQGPLGRAIRSRKPVVCEDVLTDPLFLPWRDIAAEHGIRSLVAVPLFVQEKPAGALLTYAANPRAYDDETMSLLSSLAAQAAAALENARLFGESQHNLERIQALREIEQAVTSTLDLDTILDVLLKKIDVVLPYSIATVRLLNRDSGLLEPVACQNLDENEWKAEKWKGGRGLANAVFEAKAPIMIRNAQTNTRVLDPEFYRKHQLVSYLGVPLIAKGEILGVLSFYTQKEHKFSNEEIEFLFTLAGQVAIAIQNSQLYEQTRTQAVEMEKANKVKGEFLNVMSHELRTPLNIIMGYTRMVIDGMTGEITQQQKDALSKTMRCSYELLAMINSILQTTSLEAGAVKVESQEVNLGSFLDELRSSYDVPLAKELTLNWDCPSELPVLRTDSANLKHILQNLINNAIKFTDKGHVTISARYFPEAQRRVEFKVTDTGIGIPEESLPIVFEMFRQADSSETRPYDGAGLGLYIVKRLTELLGGKVEVESESGKGSTFNVTIPYDSCRSEVSSRKSAESDR